MDGVSLSVQIPQSQVMKLVQDFGFIIIALNYSLYPIVFVYNGPHFDAKDPYYWSQTKISGLVNLKRI